jgi:hypothetical protein
VAISTITKSLVWAGKAGTLVWVTFRQVDGLGASLVRAYAAEDIAFPSTYGAGPTPAQVVNWGAASRTASDIKGRNESAAMSVTLEDPSGEIRAWFSDARQRNVVGLEVAIDFSLTGDRVAGRTPAPNWHGLIKSYQAQAGGKFQFDAQDLLSSLSTSPVPMPRLGDYFPNADPATLDRLGPRWYGHLSDERAGGGAGVVSWRAASALSTLNADFTLPTDGLVVLFNTVDAPAQILINGVPKGEVTITQGDSVGVPYAAGQTLRINNSSGSGLQMWFFGLDGETWGTPVAVTLDVDFTESAHGMILLYNPGSQGGIYNLGGIDYAEVVSSFTFPVPGTGASANAPYLGTQVGHIRTAGGVGLQATFYPFAGGSTWSSPVVVAIDGTDFTETSDGLIQLYNSGNETGTYTMAGTSFIQANEVYHMASGCSYQGGQTARVTPWGGSSLTAWFFALNGSSPSSSSAAPQGVVPPINVRGPWVDLIGEPWDLAFVVAAHAVKGNFTVYSRDSKNIVTPLASLDDTQISVPGRTGFSTRWGATPYRVVSGWRWTVLYVRGALAASITAGTVTLWANFDGVESVGDSTGTLLEAPADFLAHLLDNDILPLALNLATYIGANWRTTPPTYGDGRAARNAATFSSVSASLASILGSDTGAFGMTTAPACSDVVAALAVDADSAHYPDENGAVSLLLESPDPTAIPLDDGLTEISEIASLSLSWLDQTTNDYCFNRLTYTYAPSWDASGSTTAPTSVTLTNATAVANMRGRLMDASETLAFLTRRDATSAGLIALRVMARAAPAPRDATLTVGLFALSMLQIGSVVPIAHSDLIGSPVNMQVRGLTTNWGANSVTLTVRGLATLSIPTTTTVPGVLAEYSASDQGVPVRALVRALFGPAPNDGTVTFQLFDGLTPIGSPVTAAVIAGESDATYVLPGGTGF